MKKIVMVRERNITFFTPAGIFISDKQDLRCRMGDERISIYASTKVYVRMDGTVVRHVSNRKYVKKLPVCTDSDCHVIAARHDAGESLSVIAAEYSMSYARLWAIMKRWRDSQSKQIEPVQQQTDD